MSKKIKTLVATLVIMMGVSSTVMAAPISTVKTLDLPQVTMQSDGTEIEYLTSPYGKIYTQSPKIIKTVGVGDTLKYQVNIYNNVNNTDEDAVRDLYKTGYLTINNVVREGSIGTDRVVYAKGPVTVNMQGLGARTIIKQNYSYVDGGNLVSTLAHDMTANTTFRQSIVGEYQGDSDLVKEITEPGLYRIEFGDTLVHGLGLMLYVAGDNEDLTNVAPKTENAVASVLRASVNGYITNVPTYMVNGSNYVRVRDVASILASTPKHFDVAYNDATDTTAIKTASYNSEYVPVGWELSSIPGGTVAAIPNNSNIQSDGYSGKPSMYTISGQMFMKLDHLASIINCGLTMDSSTNTATFNISEGFGVVKHTIASQSQVALSDKALEISKGNWNNSDSVIISGANNQLDSLVGSRLSVVENKPLLVTSADSLSESNKAEIERLGVNTVYILGDTASVSQAIEDSLKQKYNVVRLGGQYAYDTALKVAQEIKGASDINEVELVVRGKTTDEIVINSLSEKNSTPILLTDHDTLRSDTIQAIQDWGVKNVVIKDYNGTLESNVEFTLYMLGTKVRR